LRSTTDETDGWHVQDDVAVVVDLRCHVQRNAGKERLHRDGSA